MGPEADRAVFDYFHDRRIWTLDGDDADPQLKCLTKCAELGPAALSQTPTIRNRNRTDDVLAQPALRRRLAPGRSLRWEPC